MAASVTTTWIPSLAPVFSPKPGPGANGSADPTPYYSPPSPVIIAASLAAALGKYQPARIVLTMYPPVSERDQPGIEELESQTTNVLSFRPLEQVIFDAQVAFNLLPGYGEASKPSLGDVRKAIPARPERLSFRTCADTRHSIGCKRRFSTGMRSTPMLNWDRRCRLSNWKPAFANLGVKVAAPGDIPAAPTNVSIAGGQRRNRTRAHQETDASIATGAWFWGVADNLRLAATNAVSIAEGNLCAKSASE